MCAKKSSPAAKAKPAVPPVDFVYRFIPDGSKDFFIPKDWEEAATELRRGNEKIAQFFQACREGGYGPGIRPPVVELSRMEVELEPKGDDGFPQQLPFATVVGCSDARVPSEILFGQEFNDIFNIRVAGNVLAPECVGSLLYALQNFVPEGPGRNIRGMKLVVALGHRGCGAVKEAVKAYRRDIQGRSIGDDPVGSILKRIFRPCVTVAARALDTIFGPGTSLDEHFHLLHVELTVFLNAAWLGHDLRQWVVLQGDEAAAKVGVVYGVVDPGDLRIMAHPLSDGNPSRSSQFAVPPRDLDELHGMAINFARGLQHALGGAPPSFHAHRHFFP